MLNTADYLRVSAASHARKTTCIKPSIIARDTRLRDFSLVDDGVISTATRDFAIGVCTDGNFIRARVLENNTLEITKAAPGSPLVWGSNLCGTLAARNDCGVSLVVSGTTVWVYWIGTNNYLRWAYGINDGVTWTDAGNIAALTYAAGPSYVSTPTAFVATIVFFTDAISATGEDPCIKVAVWDSGWTVQTWDAGTVALRTALDTYSQGSYYSGLTVLAHASGDYTVVFYASQPRGHLDAGLFSVRVSNLITGQTPHWQQLRLIYAKNPGLTVRSSITYPALYLAFPKIVLINDVYWLIVLEASSFGNNPVIHSAVLFSTDGADWSNRAMLAGTDMTYANGASNYLFRHLLGAQAAVSGNYFYFFSYDQTFRCAAALMCGVDNPARQFDLTNYFISGNGRQTCQDTGSATLSFKNVASVFDTLDVLRGNAQIDVKVGYVTAGYPAGETVQLAKLNIDRIQPGFELGPSTLVDALTITAKDALKRAVFTKPDIYLEYPAARRLSLQSIPDLTNFIILNGTARADGALMGGLIDPSSSVVDNMLTLDQVLVQDGLMCVGFNCKNGWTDAGLGVSLQIKSNTDYYLIGYGDGYFRLFKASPTGLASGKMLTYAQVPNIGGQLRESNISLSLNTQYYLVVGQWHDRVVAWYCTNRADPATWVKVIDYAPITCDFTGWGLNIKSRTDTTVGFGETHQPSDIGLASDTYSASLLDLNPLARGKARCFFERVKTDRAGKLHIIASYIRLRSAPSPDCPDAVFQLWKDYGDGSKPASLVGAGNLLVTHNVQATSTPSPVAGAGTRVDIVIFEDVSLDATTYYWVSCASASDVAPDFNNAIPTAKLIWLPYMPETHTGGVGAGVKVLFQYDIYAPGFNPAVFYDFIPNTQIIPPLTGGLGSAPSMFIREDYDGSGIIVNSLAFCSGDQHTTLETIARSLLRQANLTLVAGAVLSDSLVTLDTGADGANYTFSKVSSGTWAIVSSKLSARGPTAASWGYLFENTYHPLVGDGTLEVGMQILAANKRAGLVWRASGTGASVTTAYLLDVQTNTLNTITLSKIVNNVVTVLATQPSLVKIPTNKRFVLTAVNYNGAFYVYVDRCLAAVLSDNTITVTGLCGLAAYGNNGTGNPVVYFDSLNVPEFGRPAAEHILEAGQDIRSSLNNLIGVDRAFFFARADGMIYLSAFNGVDAADAVKYEYQPMSFQLVISDEGMINHLRAEGERFAEAFVPDLLNEDLRFSIQNYTNAYTDEQSVADAVVPIRLMRELAQQATLATRLNPAVEPQDVIAVRHPKLGIIANWRVSDMSWALGAGGSPESPTYTMQHTFNLRKALSGPSYLSDLLDEAGDFLLDEAGARVLDEGI